MIKKIFIGVLLAGVFGLLVLGAVNRTLAKSTEKQPLALSENETERFGGGNGGQGQTQASNGDHDDCLPESHTYESRLGGGKGQGQDNLNPSTDGKGPAGGNQGRRVGSSSGQAGQPEGAPADGLGTGLAEVDEWLTYAGTSTTASEDVWILDLNDIGSFEIEGRLLSFLQEKGFEVNAGDALLVSGFMEGDEFEVGGIENTTTGEQISVREETGRPLWAGGRGGGRNQ